MTLMREHILMGEHILMEKGDDFDDSFSPTPGHAVGRFMLSLAVANDDELPACDIERGGGYMHVI